MRSKQMMLQRPPEEGSDVVPVLLDGVLCVLQVVVPMPLQLVGEQSELLVVGVFLNSRPPLEAVHDQTKTDLGVPHANPHILLEKLGESLTAQILPLLIQSFHQFIYLFMGQPQEVAIGGIEKPILCPMFSLDCHQQHPVIGDGKHEPHHQRLFPLMCSKLCDQAIEFFPLLLGQQQVLVLELPGKGEEFKAIVIAKDGEVRSMLQTDSVIRPLEISVEDVLFPPRPLLRQFVLLLDCEEEAFDATFELPEGGTALHVVNSGVTLEE